MDSLCCCHILWYWHNAECGNYKRNSRLLVYVWNKKAFRIAASTHQALRAGSILGRCWPASAQYWASTECLMGARGYTKRLFIPHIYQKPGISLVIPTFCIMPISKNVAATQGIHPSSYCSADVSYCSLGRAKNSPHYFCFLSYNNSAKHGANTASVGLCLWVMTGASGGKNNAEPRMTTNMTFSLK